MILMAIIKLKSFYINRMIDDFGESVMTDGKTLNAFADRILKQAKGGKLQVVFGKEMGKSMEQFAKILKFNANRLKVVILLQLI